MTYIVSLYVICEVAFWGCVRHAIQTPSNQQLLIQLIKNTQIFESILCEIYKLYIYMYVKIWI